MIEARCWAASCSTLATRRGPLGHRVDLTPVYQLDIPASLCSSVSGLTDPACRQHSAYRTRNRGLRLPVQLGRAETS
ncbi:unnamed protein product [Protopolystoma xenopodis]|uniref:Uncharacterized protein n=1 Tax=Protopolystoma xenopodis TaxID=117903 RepID=A0A3S5C5V2_9PLAT|nr:unnamed protein product [Protopolystoma xenopodis]